MLRCWHARPGGVGAEPELASGGGVGKGRRQAAGLIPSSGEGRQAWPSACWAEAVLKFGSGSCPRGRVRLWSLLVASHGAWRHATKSCDAHEMYN